MGRSQGFSGRSGGSADAPVRVGSTPNATSGVSSGGYSYGASCSAAMREIRRGGVRWGALAEPAFVPGGAWQFLTVPHDRVSGTRRGPATRPRGRTATTTASSRACDVAAPR